MQCTGCVIQSIAVFIIFKKSFLLTMLLSLFKTLLNHINTVHFAYCGHVETSTFCKYNRLMPRSKFDKYLVIAEPVPDIWSPVFSYYLAACS